MNSSSDPVQWPDGYTYHALIRGYVRERLFSEAVMAMKEGMESAEKRRLATGLRAEGPWRHTIEYLMANLLGEQKVELAEKLREISAKHGFVMGCTLSNMEDDD
jgi:pentatricopeptide repeat protein